MGMLFVRFVSLAIIAVAIQQIAETHSFADVQDAITSSYADMLDWGVDKLTALPGSEQQALPNLQDIEAEAAADDETIIPGTSCTDKTVADIGADEDEPEELGAL